MTYFEVSVHNTSTMHVFQPENDFRGVKFHFLLTEDPVLTEMIMQIPTIHQLQNETQLVRRLKGVRHTHNEGTVFLNNYTNINHKS